MASTQVQSYSAHTLWRDPMNEASSSPYSGPSGAWTHARSGEARKDMPAPQYFHGRSNDESRRSFELPALPSMTKPSSRMSSAIPRLAGVSSILNHPSEDLSDEHRRRKTPIDSPDPSRQTLPPIVTKQEGQQANPRASSPSASSTTSTDKLPRRILTPVSPSSHPTASIVSSNAPSHGNVSTRENLFATSPPMKTFSTQSTAATPSMASLPGPSVPYSHPTPYPSEGGSRRTSLGPSQSSAAASANTSPQATYSSFADMNGVHMESNDSQGGMPVSATSRQSNNVQLMHLDTPGGSLQVPVDVQQASRAADEKRRRNAGASARFRQRRKEKERESSSTISRLEQDVREAREAMNFYRNERDYFRAIVQSQPGWEQHLARPQSPGGRHRNASRAHSTQEENLKKEPTSPALTEPRSGDHQARNGSWQQFPPSHDMAKIMNPSAPPQNMSTPHSAASQHAAQAYHHAGGMPHHPHPTGPQQPYDYARHPQQHGPAQPHQNTHQPPTHHQHPQGPPPMHHAVHQSGPNNPFAGQGPPKGHERRPQ